MSKKKKNPQAKRAAYLKSQKAKHVAAEKAQRKAELKEQAVLLRQRHMDTFFNKLKQVYQEETNQKHVALWFSAVDLFYSDIYWEEAFSDRIESILPRDQYEAIRSTITLEDECGEYFEQCMQSLFTLIEIDRNQRDSIEGRIYS